MDVGFLLWLGTDLGKWEAENWANEAIKVNPDIALMSDSDAFFAALAFVQSTGKVVVRET